MACSSCIWPQPAIALKSSDSCWSRGLRSISWFTAAIEFVTRSEPNHREGLELGNRYSCKDLRFSPTRGLLRRGFLSGSLTIGSGSAAPPVDTRRREGKLPASLVSRPFSARFVGFSPPISASALASRDRQPAVDDTPFFPLTGHRRCPNSPARRLRVETPSCHLGTPPQPPIESS
jgi:hypothetical protein